MSSDGRVARDQRVPDWRLWLGLATAPVAWIAEGLFGWFVGARICGTFSIDTVRMILGVFTLAMLGVAIATLVMSAGNLRAARETRRGAADRVEFMALAGVFVSTSFLIGIFWSGWSSVVLDTCGWMR